MAASANRAYARRCAGMSTTNQRCLSLAGRCGATGVTATTMHAGERWVYAASADRLAAAKQKTVATSKSNNGRARIPMPCCRHYIVSEHECYRNGNYVPDNRDGYRFGDSETHYKWSVYDKIRVSQARARRFVLLSFCVAKSGHRCPCVSVCLQDMLVDCCRGRLPCGCRARSPCRLVVLGHGMKRDMEWLDNEDCFPDGGASVARHWMPCTGTGAVRCCWHAICRLPILHPRAARRHCVH